jgi:hypothetical protein
MRVISMLVLIILLLFTIAAIALGLKLILGESATDLEKIIGAQCLVGALFPLTGVGIIATTYAAADQLEEVIRADERYKARDASR